MFQHVFDNIKKMGQVFSNKLEKVTLGIKLKTEEMNLDETITAVKNKSKENRHIFSILKQVYNREIDTHGKVVIRTITSQQQWARA